MFTSIQSFQKCFNYWSSFRSLTDPEIIWLGQERDNYRYVYLYYPMENLSSKISILNAQLLLTLYQGPALDNITIELITANQFQSPHYMGDIDGRHQDRFLYYLSVQPVLVLDITQLVTEWITLKRPNYGFYLRAICEEGYLQISGQKQHGIDPMIKILYSTSNEALPVAFEPSVMIPSSIEIGV